MTLFRRNHGFLSTFSTENATIELKIAEGGDAVRRLMYLCLAACAGLAAAMLPIPSFLLLLFAGCLVTSGIFVLLLCKNRTAALILLPMAFGMILANLPGSGIIHMQYFVGDGLEHPMWVEILNNGGLADMLYMGVKLGTRILH